MSDVEYDLIVVGGGLGGSALAGAMARRGSRVLLIERENQFRDRVRGEGLPPWGCAEARQLGCYEMLLKSCGADKFLVLGLGPSRDLHTTTPQRLGMLTFYHPEMQERMITAAADSGAEVRRGAAVRMVAPGNPPEVQLETDSRVERLKARLVVGADGRASSLRRWGNFPVERDPDRLLFAGVLLENVGPIPDGAFPFVINPDLAQSALLVPQTAGTRAYVGYRVESRYRLQGPESIERFITEAVRCGIPADLYAHAKIAGPLATFNGADNWVQHPYSNGIVLIGDAAATTDPIWGQGMALTLRDVRVLTNALLADDDWDRAAHAYAREHDRYRDVIHTCEEWLSEFFYGISDQANARRAKAMPLILADPTRIPDHFFSGPELPIDDSVRVRFFGEIE